MKGCSSPAVHVIQRSVSLPLKIVDQLWKRYEDFERAEAMEGSDVMASSAGQQVMVKYKAALEASKARKGTWDSVQVDPPLYSHCCIFTQFIHRIEGQLARLTAQ